MKTRGTPGVIWQARGGVTTRAPLRPVSNGGSIAHVNRRPDMVSFALALVLLSGCPSAVLPPYPGSLISIAVRISPAGARVGRVAASSDAAPAMTLRLGDSPATFAGAIAVEPGLHSVAIEVFNDADIRVGGASFRVSSARGSPALLDATLQVLAPEDTGAAGAPTVDAIVAPRSSAVQGERMLLQGVVAPTAGLVLSWTAAPSGCGTFAQPAAASTEWTAIAPGPSPVPPSNRAGEQPFLKPGDFSTPNDAYFDRAAAFVDRAAAHGIAVLLAPSYLGYDGGREGWWQELNSPVNTRSVCAGFGRYLGTRFKEKKNLIWLAGGDFTPPAGSEGEARHREILDGIRAAGASQPWTGH